MRGVLNTAQLLVEEYQVAAVSCGWAAGWSGVKQFSWRSKSALKDFKRIVVWWSVVEYCRHLRNWSQLSRQRRLDGPDWMDQTFRQIFGPWNGGVLKWRYTKTWMVYNGNSYSNGFGGTPVLGNHHMFSTKNAAIRSPSFGGDVHPASKLGKPSSRGCHVDSLNFWGITYLYDSRGP